MTTDEAATLLCERCAVASQRHDDQCWGHLCDDCFTAFCGPDFYGPCANWPIDEANDWDSSGLAYTYLNADEQRSRSAPYSWEVGYA
jgi:hypothetical protein